MHQTDRCWVTVKPHVKTFLGEGNQKEGESAWKISLIFALKVYPIKEIIWGEWKGANLVIRCTQKGLCKGMKFHFYSNEVSVTKFVVNHYTYPLTYYCVKNAYAYASVSSALYK